VADRRSEQRAERAADHEAEGSTKHFSPHGLFLNLAGFVRRR
jgi:hypothetical protein